MEACKVDNCENKRYSSDGYCQKHTMQIRRKGRIMERTRKDPNDFIIDGDICKIGCYDMDNNLVGYALVDADKEDLCRKYKWCFGGKYIISGTKPPLYLHKLVIGEIPKGMQVDHISRDNWDNRKSNLRICTNAENNLNKGKSKLNTSGYKGASWSDRNNGWVSHISSNGKVICLGTFKTRELAALAYNKAAKELHGEFAVLNKIPLLRRKPKYCQTAFEIQKDINEGLL